MQSEHRIQALSARRAIPAEQRRKDSSKIANSLIQLPKLCAARDIGFYFPMPDEVDVLEIQTRKELADKTFYLPIMIAGTKLEFAPFQSTTVMQSSRLGVKEPEHCANDRRKPHQLDFVIVPLVAFDRQCNRIGMGAGYYDRSFSFRLNTQTPKPPVLIGVAFEEQKINRIKSNSWDVPLDLIITEKRLYQRL